MHQVLSWLAFWKKTTKPEPKMHIVIERHPNPIVTTYHLDVRLSESGFRFNFDHKNGVVRPESLFSSERDELPVDPFVQSLAERIYAIPGVTGDNMTGNGVTVSSYEIRVCKGKAFNDNVIEAGVIAAIAQTFDVLLKDISITIDDQRHMLQQNRRMADEMAAGYYEF